MISDRWHERFDAFAARKTREALDARLSPMVTVDGPDAAGFEAVGSRWSRRLFDGAFFLSRAGDATRPACSLVFVQSADGNTGADDPGSLGGGATDKHLIYEGLSRVAADAVMAGAGTVRGAGVVFSVWHPEMVALRASLGCSRHPVQIVATSRGLNPDEELICNIPSTRVVLLTGEPPSSDLLKGLATRPWITRVAVDGGDFVAAFAHLRAMGIARISCVGGRSLARTLLAAGLVDDVLLTTAPHPGGEPNTPIAPWAWQGRVVVRKHGTENESNVLFEQIVPR
jgi:riboflavin biosynthesis pyrimidine reductase